MMAPYMPLFVADYLADTAHLSAAEHGAYMLLIMNYWQRQKPLPSDDRKLARIARMTDDEWSSARDAVLEFFTVDGMDLRHKRVEAELIRLSEKSDKARLAAEKSVAIRQANAERTLNGRSADAELSGKEKLSKRDDAVTPAPARATALAKIEPACLALIAGTDWPVATAQDWHALTRLAVDDGLDVETEILPAIRQQAERAKANGKRISTWGYFANGCREFARQARSPPQPLASHTPPSPTGARYTGARYDRTFQTPMQRALDALKPCGERPVSSGDGRTIDGEYELSAH
jgi:uncharacterized protein YdaU (DUF1376 family)